MKKKITIEALAVMTGRGFREIHEAIHESNKSIQDVAVVMAQGFKKTNESIEALAAATAHGFKVVDKRITELEERMTHAGH